MIRHPLMSGGIRPRAIYGHGNQWRTAIGPYQSRYQMPPEIQRLPFDLLRSHSFPKWPHRFQRGVQEWQAGGQGPVTFLPSAAATHPYANSTSPRGFVPGGPVVMNAATQQMANLQAQALGKSSVGAALSAPEAHAFLAMKRLPSPWQKFATEVPGIGAQQLPPVWRSNIPPEAIRLRAVLQDPRAMMAQGGAIPVGAVDPAAIARRIHAKAYFDPISGWRGR